MNYLIKVIKLYFLQADLWEELNKIKKSYQLGYNLTKKQLKNWEVKYNKLIMGKPSYDLIVDDLSIYFKKHGLKILINIYKK